AIGRAPKEGEVTEGNLGSPLFVTRPKGLPPAAEGWEVTEGKLGFPLFVYRPASRCEGNLGSPLFVIVFRRKNSPLRGLFFLDPRNVWHFGKCATQARGPRIADLGKIRVAVISEAPSQRNATCVALVGQQIDG
ncbi:MAG: hypothetical protein JWN13_2984, partial [Betaproteobacteria bacterium]|nr:hypothetical protein [Betaproteobacteria bacterium]